MLSLFLESLSFIFGGCCSNVYTLEALVGQRPDCGHLITFAQFVAISLEGFLHFYDFSGGRLNQKHKFQVPFKHWLIMVLLFFTLSVLNNHVFSYHISVPVHIIFRSMSLISGMLMSFLFLKKRYSIIQVIGVVLVSLGVIASTLSSVKAESIDSSSSNSSESFVYNRWLTGMFLISVSVILASILGIYQEVTYAKFGKAWKEGLFMNHALALPMFVIFWPSIRQSIQDFNDSPQMWGFLILNVVTQYVCVSGVHRLSSVSSSLTLNLVLSLRKVASLILSSIIFQNPFTWGHFCGVSLVTIGTLLYANKGKPVQDSNATTSKKED